MPADRARTALAGTRFAEVHVFDELDSTNTWLLDRALDGAPEGTVAVADHQTAGRGRLNRSWVAPPGASLLVSMLFRPVLPPRALHRLSLLVALAAGDACQALGAPVEHKWPNDLMVGDRKLAGILAESVIASGAPPAVVVGLGLNVAWPDDVPAEVAGRAVDLASLGVATTRDDLLVEVLRRVDQRYGELEGVGREYRERCATIGRDVRVDLGGEVLVGQAADIDADGRLVVVTESERRVVAAGDVVHLRPA